MKVVHIIEGNINLALKKAGMQREEVEQLAKLRLAHCEICTIRSNPGLVEGKCVLCNCKMESKVRAIGTKCPVGKW